jgi:hypothetical protein
MTPEKKDWRELCAAVAKELDSNRVQNLIEQLITALDERKKTVLSNVTRAAGAPGYD